MAIVIPATGGGDATPTVATDKIVGVNYQQVKIVDGTVGGSQGAIVDSIGNLRVAVNAATALVGTSVANFPAAQPISIASYAVTQPISIASYAVTQPISIASYAVTQPVSIASTGVLIGASISNSPAISIASTSITVGVSVAAGVGASPLRYITGASINNVNVKNTPGTVYNITAMNVTANPRYLKLYDKATVPSVGQDNPNQIYVIPGAAAATGFVIPMPIGILFANGIGFGITSGSMGQNDTTTTALGDVVVNLGYV